MDYDFSKLNDKEFEILTCDLLSKEMGSRVERFKPGKDGGVDGRFFISDNEEVVIQCKHYIKSGLNTLLNHLEKKELPKVKALNPSKYIFVTSLPLSRLNKRKIKKIFKPYIKKASDVYGCEDLNSILSDYPKIEEKHYKLWITSTTVLLRILHNAVKGRSEFLIEKIKEDSALYVHTNNHDHALEHLKKHNVIIISGEPGIGKTTLAKNLCLYHAALDYEFIAIEESIKEAEDVYQRNKKQVFYFDDFLGSNYFEAIENKKDSIIMNFIDRIYRDKSKIFILTSRTTIMTKGIYLSPIFKNKNLGNNQYLITINSLSKLEKAKILYNHIWYSELTEDHIDVYYKDKNYLKVINHRNFNPRIIEFITDLNRITTNADEYWKFIIDKLDNPHDIWDDYLKVQNNSFIRSIVYLTVFNGGIVDEEHLRVAYKRICCIKKISSPISIEYDFDTVIKLSIKSLLNRTLYEGIYSYSVFNPSISDYVLNKLENDFSEIVTIFKALLTEKSLDNLYYLSQNKYLNKDQYISVLREILSYIRNANVDFEFLIELLFRYVNSTSDVDYISSYIQKIIDNPIAIKSNNKLMYLINLSFDQLKDVSLKKLYILNDDKSLDENGITEITEIFLKLDIDQEEEISFFIEFRKEQIETHLYNSVSDIIADIDINDYVRDFSSFEIDVDHIGIEQFVEEQLSSILLNVSNGEFDDEKINLSSIINDELDTSYLVDSFIESMGNEQENEHYSHSEYDFSDIDDLFQR